MARTIREFMAEGQTGQDDPREVGEYSGAEGPQERTFAEAWARFRETTDDSTQWFMENTPWQGPEVIQHLDALVGQFTGPEVRPRPVREQDPFTGGSGLQTKGYSEDYIPALPQTFEEMCLEAMDTTGKKPRE